MVSTGVADAYRRPVPPLAIVGGTGPEGFGLAVRLAAGREAILIGSRVPARAEHAAARVRAAVPDADVAGCGNDEAITRAERVVLSVPFAGLRDLLAGAAPALAGKLVIDVIVPLTRRGGVFVVAAVDGAPSVGELVQQAVPSARVVSAFKNVPAPLLADVRAPLAGDVLLCGDDAGARAVVAQLVARIPGLRAVDVGPLANAAGIEAITPLLLNLNHRHHALTSIAVLGLP